MLERPLIVVTGKGGVGKTTVACALGRISARRGRRTIVAEVSARADAARLLGADGDGTGIEHAVGPGLHHISIDSDRALEEYLREELPRPLAVALARSQVFAPLAEAAPGLQELLAIGQVWELAQRPRRRAAGKPYDAVVLDAPATGHALALLAAPGTYAAAVGGGPVARQAAAIDAMLRDPRRTAVVAVATPEELAVNEIERLRAGLGEDLGRGIDEVVVNALLPAPLRSSDAAALAELAGDPAVASALWAHRRAQEQRGQLRRLRPMLDGAPRAHLPFLFDGEVDADGLERLAAALERAR